MTTLTAETQGVLKGFKNIPCRQPMALLMEIAADKRLCRDILDMAIITSRSEEPSRPFRDSLAEKSR